MLRSVERSLRASTACMVVSSYLAMVSMDDFGPGLLLLPILMIAAAPFGSSLDLRYKAYRGFTFVLTLCFVLALPVFYALTGLLNTVIMLVVFIQMHKLVHRKAAKDYYQLFLMCFFLLVAACAGSPDALIGVAFACFLVSAACAMLSLQLRTESEQTGPAGLADIAAGDTDQLRVPGPMGLFDAGLVRQMAVVCSACFLMTVFFFMLTPRMQAGVFGRANVVERFESGLDDKVEIASGGSITEDPSPVMRVEFPDEPDHQYSAEMYWRCMSMDFFTGSTWENVGVSGRVKDRVPPSGIIRVDRITVERKPRNMGRLVRQVVFLNEVPPGGLPCLPMPVRLRCETAGVNWDMGMGDVVMLDAGASGGSVQYEVVSEVYEPSPEQLRQARDDYKDSMSPRDYFVLTKNTLQKRSVGLARRLTADQNNVYDKVVTVENWLRSSEFTYSLDIPQLPKAAPVDAFLHDAKTGHCELFATAMALMLRSQGIPARVVSGYRGGVWSPADNAYIVQKLMAHLWVEVYFLDHGWVAFDPSPAANDSGLSSASSLRHALGREVLRARLFWHRDVIGFKPKVVLARLGEWFSSMATGKETTYDEPESKRIAGQRHGSWAILVPVMLAIAFVGAVAILRRQGRGSAAALSRDQICATDLLRRLKRRLMRHGLDCHGKTADEIEDEVRVRRADWADSVAQVVRVYNEVRFGGRPLGKARLAAMRKTIGSLGPVMQR